MNHNISIIIPTFNRVKLLNKLIKCIFKQKLPSNVLIQVVVIDDGSYDGTKEILTQYQQHLEIISGDGNWWWTKCINEGIKHAIRNSSDFVLLLNDDNEIEENYIHKLLDDYNSLPDGSILGSMSVSIDNRSCIDVSGYKSFNKLTMNMIPYSYSTSNNDIKNGVLKSVCLSGRGTLIPLSVVNRLGTFDERFVQYGSDYDYTLTAHEKGIPVYISWNAKVFNYTKLTSFERNVSEVSFSKFIKSFLSPYSSKSIKKNYLFYYKHSYKVLASLYVLYVTFVDILKFLSYKFRYSTKYKAR
jgi:N-acetylglucosaminyl-diphospho-decaprenol L-rhamnosyltransferase